MSKTCDCPTPPGGSITCSDDQLAICGYRDGKIVSGCFDPPSGVAATPRNQRITAMNNWVLERITGRSRSLFQRIMPEEKVILESGTFSEGRDTRLSFVLPTKMRETDEGGTSAMASA